MPRIEQTVNDRYKNAEGEKFVVMASHIYLQIVSSENYERGVPQHLKEMLKGVFTAMSKPNTPRFNAFLKVIANC